MKKPHLAPGEMEKIIVPKKLLENCKRKRIGSLFSTRGGKIMLKEMVCIVCPMGMPFNISYRNFRCKGNTCPRGVSYAKEELTAPKR